MTDSSRIQKTQTFIGSSSEGLAIANAVKANLMECTECHVWTEGVFLPGRTFIETLEALLDKVDYAILIATPDDVLTKRNVESFSMRDNVLLELGLFMAKLGRTRTYLLSPRDKPFHIPTDLLGLITVSYDSPRSVQEAVPTLAVACTEIQQAMKEAEKDLSREMKRIVVRRLLTLTNRLQSFLMTLQSESMRSLMDPDNFERIRDESAERLATLAREYDEDAARLGVHEQSQHLIATVLIAIKSIPFPEETVVSSEDVVSGMLGMLGGRGSVKEQIGVRLEKLVTRYEEWWNQHGPLVSRTLNDFQASLIDIM